MSSVLKSTVLGGGGGGGGRILNRIPLLFCESVYSVVVVENLFLDLFGNSGVDVS